MLKQNIAAFSTYYFMESKQQSALCESYLFILSPTFLFIAWTYSLSLWSTAIPSSDAKNANLYFLDVVQQANSIFHLFDKQFNDQLMPLIRSVLG